MRRTKNSTSGANTAGSRLAVGHDIDSSLHVVSGLVDQGAFSQIRSALDAEILFPKMPWELRKQEGRLLVSSSRGVVIAEVYEPSAAHLMASAAGMWLTIIGLIPMIERRDPVLGQELIARLQHFLGMQTDPGGTPTCDTSGKGGGR